MKPVKTHLIKINVVLRNVFVAIIKMDPGSKHFENQTDVEGPSPPIIIKTEYGNNIKIKLDMVMPKKEKILRIECWCNGQQNQSAKGKCSNFSRRKMQC